MDIATLYALRSPLGLPSHPVIFLVLGVLTWALHILAVHVTLGSALLSLIGVNMKGEQSAHWRRMALMLLEHAKIGVSIAIVIGVAPLLFVQVIYDPFWYMSNVLSARWVVGFIVVLLVAYWMLWLHYFGAKKRTREDGIRVFLGWVSLALLLLVGFIMHVLTSQMLSPQAWMSWYAPGGVIDPSGARIHDYHPARFGFFITLALPVVSAWLLACRKYLSARAGEDTDYLEFLASIAHKIAWTGGGLALALLAGWMLSLPAKSAAFAYSPWALAGIIAVLGLAALGMSRINGYLVFTGALLADLIAGILREAYRYTVLFGQHGYDFMDYRIVMDWYSTILFFATFAIVGGVSLAFMLSLSWKAGQAPGVYTASPMIARLGTLTLVVTLLWVVQYFVFGALTMSGAT